jgi:hypothetical protein
VIDREQAEGGPRSGENLALRYQAKRRNARPSGQAAAEFLAKWTGKSCMLLHEATRPFGSYLI